MACCQFGGYRDNPCHGRLTARKILSGALRKARFWEKHAGNSLNERQRGMLHRRLDGFEGKLTSSKWEKIGKCSPDTALRDITDLLKRGILVKDKGGGRSTSYSLIDQDNGRASRRPFDTIRP